MKVNIIYEDEWILEFLSKRNLLNQYKKAKNNLVQNINSNNYFKERMPKWSNIWYFRINRQFRAYWSFDTKWNLIIFKIDNHQN